MKRIVQLIAFGVMVVCMNSKEGLSRTCQAEGKSLWSFSAGWWVTIVAPINDCSQPPNGGQDLLVGSADDTLYLIEGKGPAMGGELWRSSMASTVTAINSLPDVNGDNRPDVSAGDMGNAVYCISGATGKKLWMYMTHGSILCLAMLPDINNDGVPEVLAGSEDDTVYCFSGAVPNMNTSTQIGTILWKFNTLNKRKNPGSPKTIAGPPPGVGGPPGTSTRPQGANSITVIANTATKQTVGVVIGASSDTVYCVSPSAQNGDPQIIWKFPTPGDDWNVDTCGDADGDNLQDVLVACGGDIAYLLSGKTGQELWSLSVTWGAQVVKNIGDANGDGIDDAVVGDGSGKTYCVSGKARGAHVSPLWTYSLGDSSTIMTLAAPGDLNGDGRPDCVIGSSNDTVYSLSNAGALIWKANTGGTVFSVAPIADVNNDNTADIAAGSGSSFATVYSGKPEGTVITNSDFKGGPQKGIFTIQWDSPLTLKVDFQIDPLYATIIEILDLSGKRIASRSVLKTGAGQAAFTWNISDSKQLFPKGGLYIFTLKFGNTIAETIKFAIIR